MSLLNKIDLKTTPSIDLKLGSYDLTISLSDLYAQIGSDDLLILNINDSNHVYFHNEPINLGDVEIPCFDSDTSKFLYKRVDHILQEYEYLPVQLLRKETKDLSSLKGTITLTKSTKKTTVIPPSVITAMTYKPFRTSSSLSTTTTVNCVDLDAVDFKNCVDLDMIPPSVGSSASASSVGPTSPSVGPTSSSVGIHLVDCLEDASKI